MIEKGKKVKFAYTVKVDGKDDPAGKQELQYVRGGNNIISKLEDEMQDMDIGDKKIITVSSDEKELPSYDERRVKEVERRIFSDIEDVSIGKKVQISDPITGQSFVGIVREMKAEKVVVDFNHPLAGKNCEFDVELLGVED